MTFVVAHRGSTGPARENTLEAFGAAADRGASWVELDVRSGPTGVPVVHHDPLPTRLPAWVPTLEAALDACASLELGVVVEVKEPGAAGAVDRLLAGRADPLVVSSFHPVVLERVRSVPRALLVGPGSDPAGAVEVARALGCSALHPHGSMAGEWLVSACAGAGLDVVPWTVNERRHLARLRDLGVAGVITDDVPLALLVLRRRFRG